MKYRCSKCMYEFDEDIEGEKFEDLPEHWRCPECGGQIYYFEKDGENISNYFEEKRKKVLKEIEELDNDSNNETHHTQNTNYQQIITKKEVVGLIILTIVCILLGWGILSFCNFLIQN